MTTPNLPEDEIERWLAEKLYGWVQHQPTWDDLLCHENWWCEEKNGRYTVIHPVNKVIPFPTIGYEPPRDWPEYWHPLSSKDQIFECVDKVIADRNNKFISLSVLWISDEKVWEAALHGIGGWFEATNKSLNHAIAYALIEALKGADNE